MIIDEEFTEPSTLVQIVQDLDEGDNTSLGEYIFSLWLFSVVLFCSLRIDQGIWTLINSEPVHIQMLSLVLH